MLLNAALAMFVGIIIVPTIAQASKTAPLVVVTGGYDSCVGDRQGGVSPFGSNFTAEGVRMVNELNDYYSSPAVDWRGMSDKGIRWLFTCYTKSSDLYYQGSNDDSVKQSWDLGTIVDRIENLSEGYNRPIFVIGHSHGGWLAMRLMELVRKPIISGFLATIDPISLIECNAGVYADALVMIGTGWPGSAWDRIASCRRAPGDFTVADIQRVKNNLGANPWKHYYQTHFVPLHSGVIAGGPDFSLDMTPFFNIMAGGVAASWSAHTRISNLSSIWHALKTSLMNVYNGDE